MLKKIIIGILAGLVSGLFSTGGGMILVPAFIYLIKLSEKQARATSIACVLPMVLVCSIFYVKSRYINWQIAIFCAIGGIIGGYIGTRYLNKVPDKFLKISFLLFLIYASVKMIV